MPYIPIAARAHVNLGSMANAGELNYAVTLLIKQYLLQRGEKYQTYNDILGALEGAKLELYARKIRAYEDNKMAENGDVY